MDRTAVEDWLERYGRAWETRDPAAAVQLFTEDAEYREKPFDDSMRGHSAIYGYWSAIPETQRDIAFGSEILAVTEDRAIARWWASYEKIRTGEPTRLDGVFLLEFAADGRCRSLREWWHAYPEPAFVMTAEGPATPKAASASTPAARAPILAALVGLAVAAALVFLLLK